MGLDELLASAQYVVDETGKRQAVQLDLQVWENIVSRLRESESDKNGNEELSWEAFMNVLADSQVDTGIIDLSVEHDHYLYGTPKRQQS